MNLRAFAFICIYVGPNAMKPLRRSTPDGLSGEECALMRFYNKRGAPEQWIKEGKQGVKMTRLSCHRFRSNVYAGNSG